MIYYLAECHYELVHFQALGISEQHAIETLINGLKAWAEAMGHTLIDQEMIIENAIIMTISLGSCLADGDEIYFKA